MILIPALVGMAVAAHPAAPQPASALMVSRVEIAQTFDRAAVYPLLPSRDGVLLHYEIAGKADAANSLEGNDSESPGAGLYVIGNLQSRLLSHVSVNKDYLLRVRICTKDAGTPPPSSACGPVFTQAFSYVPVRSYMQARQTAKTAPALCPPGSACAQAKQKANSYAVPSQSALVPSASAPGTTAKPAASPLLLPASPTWQKDWPLIALDGTVESLSNVEVLQEKGGPLPAFFRIHFPQGSGGRFTWKSLGKPLGGVVAAANAGTPQRALYLRYFVRFPKGFDFGSDGGLPGLFTGARNGKTDYDFGDIFLPGLLTGFPTEGEKSDALTKTITGTVGLRWKEQGALFASGAFFDQSQNSELETGLRLPADGQWHRIDLHVILQTGVSKHNGVIELSMDGKRALTNKQILFQQRSNDQWDGFLFAATYGGMKVDSLSPKDQSLDLGGIEVGNQPLP